MHFSSGITSILKRRCDYSLRFLWIFISCQVYFNSTASKKRWSSIFSAFPPPLCSFVCEGRCMGVFMALFPLSAPSLLLNLSCHPVQAVCRCLLPPLLISITPAVMRLNFSVCTEHTHKDPVKRETRLLYRSTGLMPLCSLARFQCCTLLARDQSLSLLVSPRYQNLHV